MLGVVMLGVVMLGVVMLGVVMLGVVILNVVLPSVVASQNRRPKKTGEKERLTYDPSPCAYDFNFAAFR
jgi:hypothetical protein